MNNVKELVKEIEKHGGVTRYTIDCTLTILQERDNEDGKWYYRLYLNTQYSKETLSFYYVKDLKEELKKDKYQDFLK